MDNVDIINKIVLADIRARERIDEAQRELEGLESELLEKQKAMREQYYERADRHLRDVEKTETEYLDEQTSLLNEKLEQDTSAVDKAASERSIDWVETLFREIINAPLND